MNPHIVDDEYTEVACLIGFVRRLAQRCGNVQFVATCDGAALGRPDAHAALLEVAGPLIAAVRSGGALPPRSAPQPVSAADLPVLRSLRADAVAPNQGHDGQDCATCERARRTFALLDRLIAAAGGQ